MTPDTPYEHEGDQTPEPQDPTIKGDGLGDSPDEQTIPSDQYEDGPPDTSAMFAADEPLERIDSYKVIRKLGEGGFGIVYLAEQTEPVRRQVALKVIKPGMDSAAVIARFEAERQALAILDHPGVARVFAAGSTDRGLPYFVMEYVKGIPITQHCDRHRLSISDRVQLMIRVCDAVLHAHQKGIVHRDLKPSNILVEYEGNEMNPKVIDFGIAKSLNQPLTEKTLFTREGQMVGTPEYMSPEQAEMTTQDIDTRSDIYSLGVILYQVLTGSLPFDPESLRSAGFNEIIRIIREEEPSKPSTRLITEQSKETEHSQKIADSRRADARSLTRGLRGDLDWIVMKCLEKERSRRYDSAAVLADDLRRYLDDEPVLAGPPSATYRLRKFARRHRGGLSACAAVFAVLVAGVVVSTIFAVREAEQRRVAVQERDQKQGLLDVQIQHTRDLSRLLDTLIQRVDALDESRDLAMLRVEHLEQMLEQADADDIELKEQLAGAFLELGETRWTRRNPGGDDWDAAVVIYDKADGIIDDLHARGHTSRDLYLVRAKIILAHGDHARHEVMDHDAAERYYRNMLDVTQAALEIDEQDVRARQVHAQALTNLGAVESKRGNVESAMDWYERSLKVREQLARDRSGDPEALRNLAVVLVRVGTMAGRLEQGDRHRELLERSLQIRSDLDALQPGQNRQMRDLSWGHRFLAQHLRDSGATEEALQHMVLHVQLLEKLAWLNPSDERASIRDLELGQNAIGQLIGLGGSRELALAYYQRYHDRLLEPRVAYDPSDETARRLLIQNNRARAELLLELDQRADAASACQEGARLCAEHGYAGNEEMAEACQSILLLQEQLAQVAPGG